MNLAKVLVGADPETFLFQEDKPVSAFGTVDGDKEKPLRVDRGAVQVDGMALEFNIDPASDEEEFVGNIKTVLSEMAKLVPQFRIVATPVAHFGADYLSKQPAKAVELGCNPDYNAYTQGVNEIPDAALEFRTGAGHVHIGWTKDADPFDYEHYGDCCAIIRQLDVFLGIPSVLFDQEAQRRQMYGRAGCFRPKHYGVEYRVLSNVWVASEELQRWVYRTTCKAMASMETEEGRLFLKVDPDEVQRIINDSDVEAARKLCETLGLETP